jgi:hypothetical protein
VVKDANGTLVGVPQNCDVNGIGNTCVIRHLGNDVARLRTTTAGLADTGQVNDAPYYQDSSCGTQPLGLDESSDFIPLIPTAMVLGTIAYYANGPATAVTIQASTRRWSQQDCLTAGGTMLSSDFCCAPIAPTSYVLAPLARFDLSTLGLVPPFHVEGP